MMAPIRPARLIVVVGTGTDIGKTWVAARLLKALRGSGLIVAARKPAQSFAPDDPVEARDASVLGKATGELPAVVCREDRWYEIPMAPPMAAEVLDRPPFGIADLVEEIEWPAYAVDVGLVETAGGLRSPLANDGDCLAFCEALSPDAGVLVADAGLGTINSVRLTADAMKHLGIPVVIVLNRYNHDSELHRRNLAWLRDRDGFDVEISLGGADGSSGSRSENDLARSLLRDLPIFGSP